LVLVLGAHGNARGVGSPHDIDVELQEQDGDGRLFAIWRSAFTFITWTRFSIVSGAGRQHLLRWTRSESRLQLPNIYIGGILRLASCLHLVQSRAGECFVSKSHKRTPGVRPVHVGTRAVEASAHCAHHAKRACRNQATASLSRKCLDGGSGIGTKPLAA